MSFDFSRPDTLVLAAPGFPAAKHPAEPDLFSRQAAMPGHDQGAIEAAHVAVIGCGGLGSWIALSLARLGVQQMTLIDPDRFDRTNAPRQFMFGDDVGQSKAHTLARNLRAHMTNPGALRAVCRHFEEVSSLDVRPDLLIVGVDSNAARLSASAWGLAHRRPVVFAMLSRDGLRAQIFLQRVDGPCLRCVLPNLDPDVSAPCAAAAMTSCLLATAHAVQLTVAAVCGQLSPAWRETSLDGSTERYGQPRRRIGCDCA